ncbi:Uma2 family endonuclease [Caulobacter vibrioides]|uniref:Uma2 family endonuclease n=1 Tax=Caulobacter vibrioides TaxID=155892 RepID=A0A290MFW3_CAUVI|nr:Uma2 family endonuclease [Caulobacter vibrioides]ATC30964.1 Uma2 family endonuclease [Caulobacter vibrioides]
MTTSEPGLEDGSVSEFLFDFDAFEQMDRAGLFQRAMGRVQLIEGRLLEMAPTSSDHGDTSGEALFALKSAAVRAGVTADFRFLVHATLKIGEHSAPEPDLTVVRAFTGRTYAEAADAVLVVEVSISTRDGDLKLKAPLYARAGIPEFWLIEPEQRRVTVFRAPQPNGTWASTTVHDDDDAVSPLFAPQISLSLSELF